jgi:antagonist of KipI
LPALRNNADERHRMSTMWRPASAFANAPPDRRSRGGGWSAGRNSGVGVIAPGLQTTVQDLGRWGYQAIGVAVAGPMDPFAHRLANALVGNPRTSATLEATLAGPTLQFFDRRSVAVTGASFELLLDDTPIEPCVPHQVDAGSVLRFGARRSGARAYIGVSGGFDVPQILGSRATHLPTNTGGLHGRALRRGDRIPLGPVAYMAARATTVGNDRPEVSMPIDVRVLPGPQHDRFVSTALETLFAAPYEVTLESDRMGYRLAGAPLKHRASADIISDATPLGSLQVPGSGQPLLLMADRQTAGGYPKLATVISADIGLAGQAAPGDRLRFRVCTRAEAIGALIARERPLLALEAEDR